MNFKKWVKEHPSLTMPLDDIVPPCRFGTMAIVLDGTKESVQDQRAICAVASVLRYDDVKSCKLIVQTRKTTLAELADLAGMKPGAVKIVLKRLESQHRIFIRSGARRVSKSKTTIQVGRNRGVLFEPTLTPELMFNLSVYALSKADKHDQKKLGQIIKRCEQHLQRSETSRKAELQTKLDNAKAKYQID